LIAGQQDIALERWKIDSKKLQVQNLSKKQVIEHTAEFQYKPKRYVPTAKLKLESLGYQVEIRKVSFRRIDLAIKRIDTLIGIEQSIKEIVEIVVLNNGAYEGFTWKLATSTAKNHL
jgi:hypothetical protein